MTIKDKEYRGNVYECTAAKIENALIVISYEVDGDSFNKPIFLLSTFIELDDETIIQYYLKCWAIETSYKYLKSHLGFDKYRVWSLVSIEIHFFIVFLAMNFLELFKVLKSELLIETIGQDIAYQIHMSNRELVSYIYHQSEKM